MWLCKKLFSNEDNLEVDEGRRLPVAHSPASLK